VTEFLLGCIIITGQSVPLLKCPHKINVRRVIVQELVVVPADIAMTVPVKMPLLHLRMPGNDWISEAKEIRPGLLIARTLLPNNSEFAAVAMLNVSGKDQMLRHDMQIGMATPCLIDYVSLIVGTVQTVCRRYVPRYCSLGSDVTYHST